MSQTPGHDPAPRPLPSQGRRTGRLALVLGIISLFTSLAVVGAAVGIAAIVVGIRARARARRGDGSGGGTGTAGLIMGVLSLLVAFTVASGTWVFYERHGDALNEYQECRREATSDDELAECSRRFNEAVRNEVAAG